MTTLIRDLMRRGLITCPKQTSLGEAAVLLTTHRVHSVVVIDDSGAPVGLLSDFDLLAGEWLSADAESLAVMRRMTAGELMSSPVNMIDAGDPIQSAAAHMLEKGFHRLIVREGGAPVGVISMSDFVAHLAALEPQARATVGDVMSHVILVCRPETPALEVARGLTDSRFRSVVVLDRNGRLMGLVSGWDFLGCINGRDVRSLSAADLMHPPSSISPSATLHVAAQRMIEAHRHRLVVVGPDAGGLPLGIISSYDIVHEMARPGSVWRT